MFLLIVVLFSSFTNSDMPIVVKARFTNFSVDNLGNIYLVNDQELVKHLPNTKFFARYSNLRLGTITSIDVMNPLKILVYYRDFQQIVFLDNQLSVNSEVVSLEKLGLEQTEMVCAGVNNSFWVYDKQNNELIRFDEQSKKVVASGNLKQVLSTELSPDFMLEYNNYLYVNSPASGIYVFDMFGAFSKIISIKGLKSFRIFENIVYYQKDSSLCSYNHQLFEESCTKLPDGALPVKIFFQNKKLYSAFKDSLVMRDFN